jgi:hypothetical protein
MEAQNHFYGHSAAWAAYLGRRAPRHLPGLAQHGWTAVSPVGTHFRDFPRVGTQGSHRRLLVWSHRSRGWDPAVEQHETTPIGAQLVYLALAAGPPPAPRDDRDAVVLMPVHGIQTQRVRGDHGALAREWRDAEGPATACLYASDAADPDILHAYRDAGHRVVVLGDRLDPDFLWRLWTLLGRARRVVSNRLSTPVFYAAHLGADIGVHGDALRIDGESREQNDRVRELWPELHARHVDRAVAQRLAADELGTDHVLDRRDLERALGWDRSTVVPALQYWTTSVAQRTLVNLHRKATAPGPAPASADGPEGLSFAAWLRAATTYLPKPLPRGITAAGAPVEPIVVDAADQGAVPG